MARTCLMFGDRYSHCRILPNVEHSVEDMYKEHGITDFIVGHDGNFDYFAITAVKALRRTYSDIKLLMLTPYCLESYMRSMADMADILMRPRGADEHIFPDELEGLPKRLAVFMAKRMLVDEVDAVISKPSMMGSSNVLYNRARRRGILCDYVFDPIIYTLPSTSLM